MRHAALLSQLLFIFALNNKSIVPMRISFWSRLLDTISPRHCLVCGRRLTVTEQSLCVGCNLHLPRTGFHLSPTDNVMARLLWTQTTVERASALFYFEPGGDLAELVYALKYNGRPEVGRALGALMGEELLPSGFFGGIDLIVPVPLAMRRQLHRGYNQSRELAKGLRQATGLPLCRPGDLVRTRFERSQTQLTHQQRHQNVSGVFSLRRAQAVAGHHVLLVDDVMTTGATLASCAGELLKAPGVTVSVLTLGFARQL